MFSMNVELSLLVTAFVPVVMVSSLVFLRHHREEVPPGRRDRGRADRPGAGEPHRRAGGAGLWPGAL